MGHYFKRRAGHIAEQTLRRCRAADSRQQQVEKNDVGLPDRGASSKRGFAIFGEGNFATHGRKRSAEHLAVFLVVIHHQGANGKAGREPFDLPGRTFFHLHEPFRQWYLKVEP